jgi:hypothetical protein
LTWKEYLNSDLKNWGITKELALDKREWKFAIHVPKPWSSVPPPLLPFYDSSFFLFANFFLLYFTFYGLSPPLLFGFLLPFLFITFFFTFVLTMFFGSYEFHL